MEDSDEPSIPHAMTPNLGPPITIVDAEADLVPLVISSPHSGEIYPPSLLSQARIERSYLRRLEDGCVDRVFCHGPGLGAPLLHARFARAYVDPNRGAFEFDAELFEGPLPGYVNLDSAKARAGLGSIPSRVAGHAIYATRLSYEEAQRRLSSAYWPYHHALQGLLARAMTRFGVVLLLDCHSMPSLSPNGAIAKGRGVDFALGDRYGRSCSAALVAAAEALLRSKGFTVARNRPYAGGHITASYGCPEADMHALQIEVRRGLYMDEQTLEPHAALVELQAVVRDLVALLALCVAAELTPRTAPAPAEAWLEAGRL